MKLAIESRLKSLRSFTERIESDDVPEDIRGSLYRFSAVRLCGHLEQCVQIIILERLSGRGHPKLLNFVKSHFKKGQNLKCGDIIQLLYRFDSEWGANLKGFIDSRPDIDDAISSAYGIRNPIAHGAQASLGWKRLQELQYLVEELVDGIIDATQ